MKRSPLALFALGWLLTQPPQESMAWDGLPWETPFASSGADWLAAAAKVKPKEGSKLQLLHAAIELDFQANGAAQRTTYLAIRVVTRAGAEEFNRLSATWAPWHEDKPLLEGRVLHPNGTTVALASQSQSAAPMGQIQPDVYSDRQVLIAPLPPLRAGSIIEYRSVVRGREPLFAAGVVHRVKLARNADSHSQIVRIRYPAEQPVRWQVFDSPAQPVEETADGVHTLTFHCEAEAPSRAIDSFAPHEDQRRPRLAISTAANWQHVARAYAEIIDARCKEGGLGDLAERVGKAESTRAKVAAALEIVQSQIRYTAFAFGEASIVPQAPATVLSRLFGDCKDQATLLVALLREAGVSAHVALIGNSESVDASLAGLGVFHHAIVHVRDGGADLWVDPTVLQLPVGQTASELYHTWALIASPATRSLSRIPPPDSAANRRELRYNLTWVDGQPQIASRAVTAGHFALECRQAADNAPDDLDATFGGYLAAVGMAGASEIQLFDAAELNKPLRLEGKCLLDPESPAVGGDVSEGYLRLDYSRSLDGLGGAIYLSQLLVNGDLAKEERTRTLPLQFLPQQQLQEYTVRLPPDAAWLELPAKIDVRFGPLSYVFAAEQAADGLTRFTFRFDTGHGRLTAAESQALFEFLAKSIYGPQNDQASGRWIVEFRQEAAAALLAGRTVEAIQRFQKLLADTPDDGRTRIQLADAIGNKASLNAIGKRLTIEALRRRPDLPDAHRVLGAIYGTGPSGHWLGLGAEHEEAIKSLRRAVELNPQDAAAWLALSSLYEHDPRWGRRGSGARWKEAVAACDAWSQANPNDVLARLRKAWCLIYQQQFDDAWKAVEEAPRDATLRVKLIVLGATRGVKSIEEEIARDGDDLQKASVLAEISEELANCRRYPNALAAIRRALELSPTNHPQLPQWRAWEAVLAKSRRLEDALHPEGDPRRAVQLLLGRLRANPGNLAPLDRVRYREDSIQLLSDDVNRVAAGLRLQSYSPQWQQLTSTAWQRDYIAQLTMRVERAPDGAGRVEVEEGDERHSVWYVARDGDVHVIVEPGQNWHHLAAEAETCLRRDDLESARTWLNWALAAHREQAPTGFGQWLNPFSAAPFSKAAPQLQGDKPSLELAFAILGAPTRDRELAARYVKRLRDAVPGAAAPAEDRGKAVELQARRALVGALWRFWPDECVEVGKPFCAEFPQDQLSFDYVASAMYRIGRTDALREFLQLGNRVSRLKGEAGLAWLNGNFEGAEKIWDSLDEAPFDLAGMQSHLSKTPPRRGRAAGRLELRAGGHSAARGARRGLAGQLDLRRRSDRTG